MEYKYNVKVKCLTVREWDSLMPTARVKTALDMNCRQIVHISDFDSMPDKTKDAEFEFMQLINYIDGLGYLQLELTLYRNLQDNDFVYFTRSNKHGGYHFKTFSELSEILYAHDSSFSEMLHGLPRIKKPYWPWGLPAREQLGNTPTSYIDYYYPMSRQHLDETINYPSIFADELINMNVLIIAPEEIMTDKEAAAKEYEQFFEKVYIGGLKETLKWEYMLAVKDARLRKFLDSKGIDWHNTKVPWIPLFDLKTTKKVNDWETDEDFDDGFDDDPASQKVWDKIDAMEFSELYDKFRNKALTWKNFYDGPYTDDDPDFFMRSITHYDENKSFKELHYEYPLCTRFYEMIFYLRSVLFSESAILTNKEYVERSKHIVKCVHQYLAILRWIFNYPGAVRAAELYGGKERFPDVYEKPEYLMGYDERPRNIWYEDYNGEKLKDIPAYKYDNAIYHKDNKNYKLACLISTTWLAIILSHSPAVAPGNIETERLGKKYFQERTYYSPLVW